MAQHRDNTGTCYDPFWQDHANDNLEGSVIAMRYVIALTSVSLLCWQYRQHDDAKIEEFPSPVCDAKATHWNQTQQIIRFLMNSAWVLCWWFFKRTWCMWLRCCGGMGIVSQRMRELRRLLTQSVFDLKLCHIDDFCFFFLIGNTCNGFIPNGSPTAHSFGWMNFVGNDRQRSDGYIRIHNCGFTCIRYTQKLFNVVELIWFKLIWVDLSWFELIWVDILWYQISDVWEIPGFRNDQCRIQGKGDISDRIRVYPSDLWNEACWIVTQLRCQHTHTNTVDRRDLELKHFSSKMLLFKNLIEFVSFGFQRQTDTDSKWKVCLFTLR